MEITGLWKQTKVTELKTVNVKRFIFTMNKTGHNYNKYIWSKMDNNKKRVNQGYSGDNIGGKLSQSRFWSWATFLGAEYEI